MVHIARRLIKGNYYYYLEKSVREGKKVRKVIIKYLGRDFKKGVIAL